MPTALRLRRSTYLVTVVVFVFYCVVIAEKPVGIHFTWIGDENLFLTQALELVRGHWLGPYWTNTLVKGPGYPLFLAANHILGLSIGIGQALLYFGAVLYGAHVMMRLLRTQAAFLVTLITLLTIPLFYEQSMQRLLRDTFYTSIVLLYFAALFDTLVVDTRGARWGRAAACGVLGGLVWITREEREWIIPASLVVLVWFLWRRGAEWWARALPLATIAVAFTAVLGTIASLNLAYYGRFIINEIKDANFVSAMSALQRASYPDFQPYVPVPKAARLRLYDQSPTFARLRSFLDPPNAPSPWNYACQYAFYKGICGDIAGGWFIWALRDGANRIGAHKDAATAAAFYRAIANEIETACSNGRLRCGYRLPFLIPYMNAEQMATIPEHTGTALRFVAMVKPMSLVASSSVFEDRRDEVLRLLNYPPHVEQHPRADFTIRGWYRRSGDAWFSVSGTQLGKPIVVTREESPDLVTHFADPSARRQRFTLQVGCAGDCSLTFADQRGATLTVTPHRAVFPMWYHLGDGSLYLDQRLSSFRSPRAGLYATWTRMIQAANPALSLLVAIGFYGFVALLVVAVRRREFPPALVALLALWVAVFSRVGLVSLIAAGSFSAISYTYLSPAVPLAVLAGATVAVVAGAELITAGRAIPTSSPAPAGADATPAGATPRPERPRRGPSPSPDSRWE